MPIDWFDDVVSKGQCPACGSEVAKPLGWFKLTRAALAQAPTDRGPTGPAVADKGAGERGEGGRGEENEKKG